MAKFDMMTVAEFFARDRKDLYEQAWVINDRHFMIDTADRATVDEWEFHNGHITTCAMQGETVRGFYNVMPLTKECAALFEREDIKEEDLRPEHILKHEFLPYAESAYFAAIAIDDTRSFGGRQCVAALLSTVASHLLYGYKRGVFKKLYANPTTFSGSMMVRRMGLKPLVSFKKSLKANDIYALEMNAETIAYLENLEQRYARFVGDNPWAP
jgi:hypothetical protein